MFWSLHATKGGTGVSVVAAALALELAHASPSSSQQQAILVDFDGDQPDILGVDAADRYGVVDWLMSEDPVEESAVERLLLQVAPGLSLLPTGRKELTNDVGSIDPSRIVEVVKSLGALGTVIGDLGLIGAEVMSPRSMISAASDRRTLLVRPCYLALRRAAQVPVSFDSLVEVYEDGRALRTLDVEAVMGMEVCARLRVDPVIARAVDSGTLTSRRPRALKRLVADLLAEHEYGRYAIERDVIERDVIERDVTERNVPEKAATEQTRAVSW